jgi:oligopeptide/dipeptide ABC transporter ATP-binding protein
MAEPWGVGDPSVVLEVDDLSKRFVLRRPLGDALRRQPAGQVRAVDGVSFRLQRGEVLAVVGESGCGKTTLASMLLGLQAPTAGRVVVRGQELTALGRRGLNRLRREVQIVFQDPYEALNPRRTVAETVSEPLRIHRLAAGDEARDRVTAALRDAGLDPPEQYLPRLPHELSGGQRQRVCIAAALVLRPKVLIADEPVSMLDVSTRAEILNLLRQLAADHGVAVVMITHDLSTVAAYSDRLVVMYLGRIVETGPTRAVLAAPQHPYTQALLSVVPVPDPRRRRTPIVLAGEPPDPADLPAGCRFHPRCPLATPDCASIDPALLPVAAGHDAACILVAPA